MIYNVTSDFVRINENSGTIQNNSRIYDVEISNQAVANSGILLYPLNKFSWSNATLYARCEAGGWAEVRVVPFIIGGGIVSGGSTSTDTDNQFASDTDAGDIINDALNGNYTPDPDTAAIIDEMMTSTDPIDTGDGFNDYLNDLFNP